MKSNPYLVSNYFENSNLFKGLGSLFKSDLFDSHKKINELRKKNSPCLKSVFRAFWHRLLSNPQDFSINKNATISSILLEDKGIDATEAIKSVLSRKLNVPQNSISLNNAIKETRKIFHEDFPADFILEYQGERLGMMLLDICYDTNKNPKPIYKFNQNLKSFRGLY